VLQRVIRSMVRAEFGIKIAQNSDADGVAHGLIVLERMHRPADGFRKRVRNVVQGNTANSVRSLLDQLTKPGFYTQVAVKKD
jgi:hypothetical protein